MARANRLCDIYSCQQTEHRFWTITLMMYFFATICTGGLGLLYRSFSSSPYLTLLLAH